MQWFSTRVPPVQSRSSARSYTNFILIIKLNTVFCVRQLNYCPGVSRVTGMFPWGSAPAKRLKTTGLMHYKYDGFLLDLWSISSAFPSMGAFIPFSEDDRR